MDASTAEWKKLEEYLHKWAEQISWMARLFNSLVSSQDMRGKAKLDALDEDMRGGVQEAYRRLQQAGWMPRWLDSTAVARLPVRAVVPARIIYSGRKTTTRQIDRAELPANATSAGGRFFLDQTTGDSAYARTAYQGEKTIRQDTLRPQPSKK